MTVAEFDTKIAIVVRDDLAAWQRLNVTAFLMSGLVASAGAEAIGEDYLDGDGARYLPLLVQPVLVFETGAEKLRTLRERAARREVPVAIYTADMFVTGNDADNRAAVRAVATEQLDLVGLGSGPGTATSTRSCAASSATRNAPLTRGTSAVLRRLRRSAYGARRTCWHELEHWPSPTARARAGGRRSASCAGPRPPPPRGWPPTGSAWRCPPCCWSPRWPTSGT